MLEPRTLETLEGVAEADIRRMEAAFNMHADYEAVEDLEGTMATVSANPSYEFVTLGWRVDGRHAVREMYQRLSGGYSARIISSRARVLALAPNALSRESYTVLSSDQGPVACQSIAVITFEGDLVSAERFYSDATIAKAMGDSFGPDFGDIPGISRLG